MTTHAEALAALFTTLKGCLPLGATLIRANGIPQSIPPAGMLVQLHTGGCEEAEPILSPLQYAVVWGAVLTVDASTEALRAAAMAALSARISANRTLGGVVDFIEIGMPETEVNSDPKPDGGQQPPIHSAKIPLRLSYTAPSPAA